MGIHAGNAEKSRVIRTSWTVMQTADLQVEHRSRRRTPLNSSASIVVNEHSGIQAWLNSEPQIAQISQKKQRSLSAVGALITRDPSAKSAQSAVCCSQSSAFRAKKRREGTEAPADLRASASLAVKAKLHTETMLWPTIHSSPPENDLRYAEERTHTRAGRSARFPFPDSHSRIRFQLPQFCNHSRLLPRREARRSEPNPRW